MPFSIENITYRFAHADDCELYFEWVNDEMVRQNAHNTALIKWIDHEKWFKAQLLAENLMLVFFDGETPVGQLRIEIVNHSGIIDFSIDRRYRGKNIGHFMLTILIRFVNMTRLLERISAEVKTSNIASLKAFTKANFSVVYEKKINEVDCKVFEYVFLKQSSQDV
jgi:RimJ/RimL family protein N-acetyltransferase